MHPKLVMREAGKHCIHCMSNPPDTVQHVAVWVDADVKVWSKDGVESADFFIPEESVRHPDLAGVRQGQVLDLLWG